MPDRNRSNRNPKTGGRIPAQGRAPSARGVGANARRHDLEQPATPGLSGELQHGEVQELEQGQAIAPRAGQKRVQEPAQGSGSTGQRPQRTRPTALRSTSLQTPDAIDFAGQRLGNTLDSAASGPPRVFDPSGWLPILRRIANTPGTGALLTRAFADQLGAIVKRPYIPNVAVVDRNALDDALRSSFNDG